MASFEEMKANLRTEMSNAHLQQKEVGIEETRERLGAIQRKLKMIKALEMNAMKIGLDLSRVKFEDLLQFSSTLASFVQRYEDINVSRENGDGRK